MYHMLGWWCHYCHLPANVVSFTVEYDDQNPGVSSDDKLFDIAWNDFGDINGQSSIGDGSIIPFTTTPPITTGVITGFAAKFVDSSSNNLVAPPGKSNDRDNSKFRFEITLGANKIEDFQNALLMTGGELQIRHRDVAGISCIPDIANV